MSNDKLYGCSPQVSFISIQQNTPRWSQNYVGIYTNILRASIQYETDKFYSRSFSMESLLHIEFLHVYLWCHKLSKGTSNSLTQFCILSIQTIPKFSHIFKQPHKYQEKKKKIVKGIIETHIPTKP